MKKIKAFSLVFVVLALLVSLSACGKDDNKALVGTWKADLDATQIIDEQLSSLGMEDLALESRCVITLVLEFDAEQHYTVRAGDVLSDKKLQKEFGGDYDVIVANIVADVIIALAPQVGKLLKKGGIFLCSGIIDDRADEVREKLVEAGWTIEETRSSEGWFSYLCR